MRVRRVSVFPLLFMVSLSFQPTNDILSSTPVAGPSPRRLRNYVPAWTENNFSRFFLNSLTFPSAPS